MFEFLLKIWALARPYRFRLVLGVLTGVIGGLVEPMMIATVVFVYGLIFPSPNAASMTDKLAWAPEFVRHWLLSAQQALSSHVHGKSGAVLGLVALVPGVMLLRSVFSYLNNYFLQWAAVRAITDLRTQLFEHLINLSAGFLSRTGTGELMSRISSDTLQLQNVISNQTQVIVKDPVTLVGLLAYLFWQQPKLTLISILVMPVCMLPLVVYNRKVRRSSYAMQKHYAELATVMSESFTGNRVIKAYNLEAKVVGQFRATAQKFVSHVMRIVRSSEIPGPLIETVGAAGIALVLAYLVLWSGNRPSSTQFLAFVGSMFAMYRPLKNLTRLYNNLAQARAASERVFELLAEKNEIAEPLQPKLLRAAGAPIYFEDVEFSYGEKMVLRDINLTVDPGQLVAVVGASGSGKTTLTNLLLRFYDPQHGSIRIGGTDVREVSTRELRSQIAVVTQETVLFNDTIYNNIELGRPGATREEILQAAKHAYAYDFIMAKPNGFDTVIGEKGVLLSGGQRQRLAIARAVLKDAPILVLDEATSSLDTESERAVQAALEELMRGRTTICIAHRLSTIQKADLIVVLDSGRIIETGTHAELMQARGTYCKLHELQFEPAPA